MNLQEKISAIGARAEADPLAPLFGRVMAAQAADPENFVSLAVGAPDPNVLPVELTRELIGKVLDEQRGRALNYTRPEGLPPFCQAFVARMQKQGISYDPEKHDVLATSGGMEAISMASEMLLDPGDIALAESPSFAGALSVFKLWGADIKHVACDQHGLDPQALEEAIKAHNPKLVFLMPDAQNPGGTTMPLERRKQIAEVLKKYGVYAIEDCAYSQLQYEGEVLPTIQSLLPDQVIIANSVSKILFPAARLGMLLAPKDLISAAARTKSSYNMQASGFMQAVAALYLDPQNHYMDDYLNGVLKEYAARRDAMDEALTQHFGGKEGFAWVKPRGGMFVWLEGPEEIDFVPLVDEAIKNGMAFVPGDAFYADGKSGRNAARLNFASTPREKIGKAVAALAKTVFSA